MSRRISMVREGLLLSSLLAGPVAWAVHLAISYTLATLPCIVEVESTRPHIYVVTVIAALIALASTLTGIAEFRRSRARDDLDLSESRGRPGFMGLLGALISGISLIAIIVASFAMPYLTFCSLEAA